MTLARRHVLFGGGASAAIGIVAMRRQLPASVPVDLGQMNMGPRPRDVVVLHSADALGQSFANAARNVMAVEAPAQKVTAITLGTDFSANYTFIKTALAASRGKRLLAFLNTQDELVLNADLRGVGGVHYFQGLHGGGSGFSRHLIRASHNLPNVGAALAASLHGGSDDFLVRAEMVAATSPGGGAPVTSIASTWQSASWPAALGSLLGSVASGGRVTTQEAVMQRGYCAGRSEARASLLVDL